MSETLDPRREPRLVRQEGLNLDIPNSMFIVGVGGVGMWVAYLAAMMGVKNLTLCDPDVVELSNENRLPLTKLINVRGEPILKVNAAAELCLMYTRSVFPIASRVSTIFLDAFRVATNPNFRTVVVCCTDNIESQRFTTQYCMGHGVEYFRAGCGASGVTVTTAGPPEWGDTTPGYGEPSWVIPPVIAASLCLAEIVKKSISLSVEKSVGLVSRREVANVQTS